jgi:lipid II:glycine glycyltransferase (peptidoglycan interpeptide bridge formation enzyme)
VIAVLGDTAFYVFGASDDRMLPLKAGYALQWGIIHQMRVEGVRWYDLGGEAREPGLRQFKKSFVGKQGSIVDMIGEFDYWNGVGARMVAEAIYMLRECKRAIRYIRYQR